MEHKLTSKKITRAVVCGLIGVLVLSVSAFAAYGSSGGYGKYKDAVIHLLNGEETNLTAVVSAEIQRDGKVMSSQKSEIMMDGKNGTEHSVVTGSEDYASDVYYSVIDGKSVRFWAEDDTYYAYDENESFNDLTGPGNISPKMIKFASLLADTFVGDLKNNVVLVSEEDGISNYEIRLKANQLPAVITAGFDVVLENPNSSGWVNYEEYDDVFAVYYEKQTGKKLPSDFFDVINAEDCDENVNYDSYWELYDEYSSEMDAVYEELRIGKGEAAMLRVNSDGSTELFDNYSDFAEKYCQGSDQISDYLGQNAVLDECYFAFSLDKQGRLTANTAEVSFNQTDKKGAEHQVKLCLSASISDYGTTKVVPFDTGDRTKSED